MKFCYFLFLLPYLLQAGPQSPEVFNINLDLPPGERFKEVVLAKKQGIIALKDTIIQFLNVSEYTIKALGYYEEMVYSHENCYEELLGVAKYSGLSFGETFLINFIYEILASCTSIVSIDNDGNILHGRNLDYNFKEILVDVTVRLRFWRNGTMLYEGDGEAGYLGLVTGLRPGAFGVTINERNKGGSWETIFKVLIKKTFAVPYFIRKVLENAENFTAAVDMFTNEEFGAPCYLIVSGIEKNEGVVITRDRDGLANVTQIDVDQPDQWFFVQTNYDRDIPDPPSDYRRVPAENRMREIGREGISSQGMFDGVLNLVPSMRPSTILTSIMSAKTGYFNTTIWG